MLSEFDDIENLDTNPTFLFNTIQFVLTGPTADFGVFVVYVPPHGDTAKKFFSVANGGLHLVNGKYFISAGNGNLQIPVGSRLNFVDFELVNVNDCNSPAEIVDVSNVFVDKTFVNYELDHGVIENENDSCFSNVE